MFRIPKKKYLSGNFISYNIHQNCIPHLLRPVWEREKDLKKKGEKRKHDVNTGNMINYRLVYLMFTRFIVNTELYLLLKYFKYILG